MIAFGQDKGMTTYRICNTKPSRTVTAVISLLKLKQFPMKEIAFKEAMHTFKQSETITAIKIAQ